MFSVPNIKFKTEYCLFWKEGKPCQKGYACFFAHGEEQLRTIQQNQEHILSQNSLGLVMQYKPKNYKTIYCKFYSEGTCKLGNKCTYAHQKKQKRKKHYHKDNKNESKIDYSPYWQNLQYQQQYYNQIYYQQMIQSFSQIKIEEHSQNNNYQIQQSSKQNINQLNYDITNITNNNPILQKQIQKVPIKSNQQTQSLDQVKNE